MSHYLGVINRLLNGDYKNLSNNQTINIPIKEIVIDKNIQNVKFDFTEKLSNKKNIILAGKNSYQVFGEKVLSTLNNNNIDFDIKILERYESTKDFAKELALSINNYQNVITIGSGSVIDISKFVSKINSQNLFVFCSSLSAAATTSTVSLLNNGIKESISSKIPDAIKIGRAHV